MPKQTSPDEKRGQSAEELQARSLELLDFEAVRLQVADHTSFPNARDLALGLAPSIEPHEVRRLQRETGEGRRLLDIGGGEAGLHLESDPSEHVQRAALGGTLTGLELLRVSELAVALRRARSTFLRSRASAPVLADIADLIPDLLEVEHLVGGSIGVRGEVMDSATPTLGSLRRQVRDAYHRVTEALTGILNSQTGAEALQDQVISIRAERLVLQVKAEMRHRVPGIVHGASNTGATLFIEPLSTIDACNTWRELVLEEEREVARVLADLSALVGSLAEDIRRGAAATARLDFIMARARHGAALDAVEPESGGRWLGSGPPEGQPAVMLVGSRHPVLGAEAVPINISIGPGWSVLVITGPNTGGKTVAMKMVGLLALMHQSGLQIPAGEGSRLPVFDGVYADVGDQQSIEQSVSTFSSHMSNVIDIIARATPRSLVLFDELGSSTDPEEGSALAMSILGRMASRGVATIATTHHRTVASYADTTEGMTNASVELDPDSLRPTYHLTIGVPGRSYAMSVASHMGLPLDIMESARSLLEPQRLQYEERLNELQRERQRLQEKEEMAEEARADAASTRQELESQIEELASKRHEILDSVRAELQAQYESVTRRLRRAEAALSWAPPPVIAEPVAPASRAPSQENVDAARAEIAQVKPEIARVGPEIEAPDLDIPSPAPVDDRPLTVGDPVDVRGLNLQGTIVVLSEEDQEADVAVGNVRLRLDLSRLVRTANIPPPEEPPEPRGSSEPDIPVEIPPSLPSRDLDLRGVRAEPAIFRLDEFLVQAVGDGLSAVRVIHGHGTGVMRRVVREQLERHSLVKAFAAEVRERGGDGVTVVELT